MGTICNKADINKSFSTFHNKLNKLLNKHAPLKPISKRSFKKQQKPWITKGIRRSIKIKNSLYYSGDIKTYKMYRNKILMLTRISKRNFFHNYFEDNLSNIKKTWEGINNLLGRKRKAIKQITALKRPGSGHDQISYNSSEFPDIMNKYFSSIGHNLASKMPNSKKEFFDYLPKSRNVDSFFFNPVTQTEIESEIMNIPLNKAHGLYSFPTRILRSARHILSHPLSELINKSVEHGIYPSKLKLAKVIPIITKVMMNLTHPTIDLYPCFQSSTESSKKWCIFAWNHFLKSSVFSMIHNMVFVKSGPLNMLFWKSPIKSKLIWTESCTPAEYLLIYKKLLTQSTTQYF